MITLAIGQILWGMAYRWIGLTGGDNGINLAARPQPLGISLAAATPFYCFTLIVFLLALACRWRCSSPRRWARASRARATSRGA